MLYYLMGGGDDDARIEPLCGDYHQDAFQRYSAAQQATHSCIASVGIDGELLAGSLPVKQLKMVVGWLALHEEEAYAAWNKAVRGESFDKIKPLI